MKKGFWTSDWFAGVIVTLVVVGALQSAWLQSLERSAYDLGVSWTSGEASEEIAVIAIDEQSIANLGRWPWPRDVHGQMVDKLAEGGAKVIGTTAFFLEPQIDPGLEYLSGLSDMFAKSGLATRVPGELEAMSELIEDLGTAAGKPGKLLKEYFADSSLNTQAIRDIKEFSQVLANARDALNTDASLARAMGNAKNVIIPMPFVPGEPLGKPDEPLPDYVQANALPNVVDEVNAQENFFFPLPTLDAISPIPEIGNAALGIGHLNKVPDVDGGIRFEALVLGYYDQYYPSLALMIAAKSRNLGIDDVLVRLGDGVQLGRLAIKTNVALEMNTFFYAGRDGREAFPQDSFFDVITGTIPAEKYKDKIVLIGATAAGLGSPQVTPISPNMPPVLTLAHTVSSILNEDFFVQPSWANWATWGVLLLSAVFLIALLPKLKAGPAAGLTIALVLVFFGVQMGLMTTQRLWLEMMSPIVLLVAGYLLITTKRFLVTERGKELSDMESAQSHRMLGLTLQGQGQLDQAFDHFRRLAMDDSVMDLLYNLALDFERKRQFNKAGSVYSYMNEYDPKFRDLEQRSARSKALEETVMLGGGAMGSTTAGGTLLLEGGGVSKPMLGRYEVEKELGKGAMGVVYLGKDPKINRVVAIKTMALSQEFEEDELDEVKERFFREAETAGRLTHPNIVTIYDAGEEHDLAYIAMEFLKGSDLAPYTKPDALLDVATTIDIVTASASALSYAHGENVVHRDIKPANIMYEAESKQVKLTDFGIARITDSSKTKTGMVLGTPSYMSPEQLSGKRVDGRSDLFSLGVMLFQMLTGQLPFKGDSMATLMFMIANESHPDLLQVRADLPPELKHIIDRALSKDVDERYQTGADMEKDLRALS